MFLRYNHPCHGLWPEWEFKYLTTRHRQVKWMLAGNDQYDCAIVVPLRITAANKAQQGLTLLLAYHTPSLTLLQLRWPLPNFSIKSNSCPPLSIFLFSLPGMFFLQVLEWLIFFPSIMCQCRRQFLRVVFQTILFREPSSWDILCQVSHLLPSLHVIRWSYLVHLFPWLLLVSTTRTAALIPVGHCIIAAGFRTWYLLNEEMNEWMNEWCLQKNKHGGELPESYLNNLIFMEPRSPEQGRISTARGSPCQICSIIQGWHMK